MAEICVIVPVYNVEPYLCRCLDSILAQTYQDFEILLINDGSADGSGVICDQYALKDPRIHVIHQENRGIAAVRSMSLEWALDNSESTWIAFVDSDDCIANVYLERLMKNALRNNADIASCAAAITYFEDPQLRDVPEIPSAAAVITNVRACQEVYKINGITTVTCWGKLIKKKLFEGIRFPEGKIHEDEAIIPQVLYRANRIAASQDQLYYYFQSANSIMRSSFSLKRFQAIEAIDGCIAFFRQQGEESIVAEAQKRRSVLLFLSIAYGRRAGFYRQIPDAYRIPEWKAMLSMQKNVSFEEFTWHLGKFYPKLVRPYSYLRKLFKLLHLV